MTRSRRALLTETNREYLPNQGDYYENNAKQNRHTANGGIHERLEHSIKDFTLLFDHMSDRERRKVFGDERGVIEDDELRDGARDTLAFILREAGVIRDIHPHGSDQDTAAKQLLIEALQRVADEQTHKFVITDLEFKPDTEGVNIEGAKEKARNDEELTLAEIRALVDTGYARLELNE